MELFHIHLLGNHDEQYQVGKEFIVNPLVFNNRMYDRVMNMNPTVPCDSYSDLVEYLNRLLKMHGLPMFEDRINLGELLEFVISQGCSPDELRKVLIDAKNIILNEGINIREIALENYRKDYCNDKPSRFHSLFACNEEGLNFWIQQIRDNELDIFRIEVDEEPFVSNELLLPNEKLSYGEKIIDSCKYWYPNKEYLNNERDEYLVQGGVKILEKVGEARYR